MTLDINKIEDIVVSDKKIVKVTTTGNIIEIMYSEKKSNGNSIIKLNANEYMDSITGEIKEYTHTDNRSQSKNELRKTFKKIRDIINCNVSKPQNCKWITLTYRDNMTDTKRLYNDCRKYIQRLKYKYGHFEYIQVAEPHASGEWHVHMIMIFDKKAPFINNDTEMAPLWGQGHTKTQKLDNVDNLGAYLSAYLGDICLEEIEGKTLTTNELNGILGKDIYKKDGKSIIKGGRLHFYPTGFNIYRCSRGIKRPIVEKMTEENAKKKVGSAKLTFQKTIQLENEDNGFQNTLNYRYYNMTLKND